MADTAQPQRQLRGALTRVRVLDAAVRVLVQDGYAGASTLRIQEVAGVSRGRLLHQFASRDELLVAAAGHLASTGIDRINQDAGEPPADPWERIDRAVEHMWRNYCSDYFWAATELWLAARHHPELREALGPAEHHLGERVRQSIDRKFGPALVERPAYRDLRWLLSTSMRGVALTYAFHGSRAEQPADPHVDGWKRLARDRLLG